MTHSEYMRLPMGKMYEKCVDIERICIYVFEICIIVFITMVYHNDEFSQGRWCGYYGGILFDFNNRKKFNNRNVN